MPDCQIIDQRFSYRVYKSTIFSYKFQRSTVHLTNPAALQKILNNVQPNTNYELVSSAIDNANEWLDINGYVTIKPFALSTNGKTIFVDWLSNGWGKDTFTINSNTTIAFILQHSSGNPDVQQLVVRKLFVKHLIKHQNCPWVFKRAN